MRSLLVFVLLPFSAIAQQLTIPPQSCTAIVTCQGVQVTIPTTPTPVPTPTPQPGSTPVVTALPMGWKVNFAPVAGAINYVVVDPNQHWLSSSAGSPHLQSQPPLFAQGVSGPSSGASAAFQVFAQTASGWSKGSPVAAAVKVGGSLPAYTDPYWVYHGGSFNWSCDFSQPGGDAGALLPQYGGTGGASNLQDVDIAWFDGSIAPVSGPGSVRIKNRVTGNFSPCALGTTIDLVGHPYAYWIIAIQPEYFGANYTLVYEGLNDLVVSNTVTLAQYVTRPAKGSFTSNAWNFVNVPMSALAVRAGVYKTIIQQMPGQSGTWHVDDLGWASAPR
jgi:hypothetical protein